MDKPNAINPDHYKACLSLSWGKVPVEVIDIIEAFGLQKDHYLATAVQYILRCGRKDSSAEGIKQDLEKAVWFLKRRINAIE